MYRSFLLILAVAGPVLAQRPEQQVQAAQRPDQQGTDRFATVQPPVATRQPALTQPRVDSLSTEPRVLNNRVDAGLVARRPPDESEMDMEAVLRRYLPDEETLRRDEARMQPAVRRMQGIWRVEKMTLDGMEVHPSVFAGTKYMIQDRVLFQSETAETWTRVWPVPAVIRGTDGPRAPEEFGAEPGLGRPRVVVPPTPDVVPLGPAGESRPAGAEPREDPRQEEGVRMNFVYQGPGQARVFWWNRYGETADPHLSRNRPSLRVALPVRGNVTVGENTMTLDVRGFGLRAVLPSRFHTPLNPLAPVGREEQTTLERDRRVSLVLVRDEAEPEVNRDEALPTGSIRDTRPNIIPTMQRVNLGRNPRPGE